MSPNTVGRDANYEEPKIWWYMVAVRSRPPMSSVLLDSRSRSRSTADGDNLYAQLKHGVVIGGSDG